MKGMIAVCCLALLAAAQAHPHEEKGDHYTTQYDNVDLDGIIGNHRLLKAYIDCLLETGPCTTEGNELKSLMHDALSTECTKCSAVQKDGTKKVIHKLITDRPEDWGKLKKKYDETGEYSAKYEKELEELKKQ